MTDNQEPRKDMSPRQVALWLARGRQALALKKAEPVLEASVETTAIPAPRPPREMPKVTKGQVAAFLWMPQFNLSFQAFSFPLALLVQTFAQILSSVGLLAANHPARSFFGAKSYGLLQVLSEAHQNLPPIRALWGETRMATTRQYSVFAASLGVLVTGGLTILTMFSQLFLGTAKAFAQAPYDANVSLNFVDNGKLGLAFINAIFSPNGSDVISAALGEMFRFYSSTMLVFAGIIVLWIVISAVAETARTGIPFGKQFNHIWAPIRLVVALGLLVPLGSGLNSGQWLIIGLTKWGSQQADQMWQSYAGSVDSGTATASTVNNVLQTVPVASDNYRAVSDKLFDILLCQQMWNQKNPGQAINPVARDITNNPANAQILNADGETQAAITKEKSLVAQVSWTNGGAKIDCGSANFMLIRNQNNPNAANTTPDNARPAQVTEQTILNNQASELQQFVTLATPLASQLAAGALMWQGTADDIFNLANYGIENPVDFWNKYDQIADAYAAGRANSLATSLRDYNRSMNRSIKSDAEKYGWISAPAWLNKLAEQNGIFMDAATTIPTIYSPGTSAVSGSMMGPAAHPNISGAWDLAYQYMGNARAASKAAVRSNASDSQAKLAQESFAQILQPSNNPLGKISSYGRKFMSEGLKMTFASGVTGVCEPEKDAAGNIRPDGDPCKTIRDPSPEEIRDGKGNLSLARAKQKLGQEYGWVDTASRGAFGGGFLPGDNPDIVGQGLLSALNQADQLPSTFFRPAGSMLISFGFMAGYVLPLLPFIRFMLGILGWILLLMEAVLAVPLLSISLLKTDGEGFMTQNFQTGAIMVLALIIRPILMLFGLLMGIMAFNGIMNITNVTFLAAADPDNSLTSMVVYLIVYGMLAYTLANSAFKAIDILPNQVMSWLGARLDQRVDDASVVHQQSSQMVGNLGMVTAMGGGIKGTMDKKDPSGNTTKTSTPGGT